MRLTVRSAKRKRGGSIAWTGRCSLRAISPDRNEPDCSRSRRCVPFIAHCNPRFTFPRQASSETSRPLMVRIGGSMSMPGRSGRAAARLRSGHLHQNDPRHDQHAGDHPRHVCRSPSAVDCKAELLASTARCKNRRPSADVRWSRRIPDTSTRGHSATVAY
jgi:hypothetical protein